MFKEENGLLVTTYDPKLAATLAGIGPEQPLPALWKEFDALANVPVMIVRGANSDVLSATTVDSMQARHPAIERLEVPDQGHAPPLADIDTIGRIAAFVSRC
jgi:pimeloyl-ACP methyl ester carboxylesterase